MTINKNYQPFFIEILETLDGNPMQPTSIPPAFFKSVEVGRIEIPLEDIRV